MVFQYVCMIDQKPIQKGPAYVSRDKKGYLCTKHRDKEEKENVDKPVYNPVN